MTTVTAPERSDAAAVEDHRKGTPGTPAIQSAPKSRFATYIELGKVRLASMAVFSVVIGALSGAAETPSFGLLLSLGVGAMLVAMSGHALNMLAERDVDALMKRTRSRPLPSGRLTGSEVLGFGVLTGALGLILLAATVHPLATAVCAAILGLYVFAYTPLKRISSVNTLVGAVPGALPPVVGYAAVHGQIDARAMVLFAILFLWQIPHFLAISWRYRDDYRAGGMKMLAVEDTTGHRVGRQMVAYCAALVAVSTLPTALGMTGEIYLIAAVWLGVLFLVPTSIAAVMRTPAAMRQAFMASLLYLPLLFLMLVLDGRNQATVY